MMGKERPTERTSATLASKKAGVLGSASSTLGGGVAGARDRPSRATPQRRALAATPGCGRRGRAAAGGWRRPAVGRRPEGPRVQPRRAVLPGGQRCRVKGRRRKRAPARCRCRRARPARRRARGPVGSASRRGVPAHTVPPPPAPSCSCAGATRVCVQRAEAPVQSAHHRPACWCEQAARRRSAAAAAAARSTHRANVPTARAEGRTSTGACAPVAAEAPVMPRPRYRTRSTLRQPTGHLAAAAAAPRRSQSPRHVPASNPARAGRARCWSQPCATGSGAAGLGQARTDAGCVAAGGEGRQLALGRVAARAAPAVPSAGVLRAPDFREDVPDRAVHQDEIGHAGAVEIEHHRHVDEGREARAVRLGRLAQSRGSRPGARVEHAAQAEVGEEPKDEEQSRARCGADARHAQRQHEHGWAERPVEHSTVGSNDEPRPCPSREARSRLVLLHRARPL
eukprot:scaffold1816_cov134-Isochrysis_galbana.AAC.2